MSHPPASGSSASSDSIELPNAFARAVVDSAKSMMDHQQPDGSIIYDPRMGLVYPQQAIFPMAFCLAGLDPEKRYLNSTELRASIGKLGQFLTSKFDDRGHFYYEAHGFKDNIVDQRLTYAWIEGLRILREANQDFPYEQWADKILRACNTLLETRVKKLAGLRRFNVKFQGTGTNHVVLYLTTIFRAGQVLNKPELVDFVLPIARAMAADVHPDGYWEEHSDLLRAGGPTPGYNYLSHNGMALMFEWTGEKVFRDAIMRSTRFHENFCYPDGLPLDLIDERVRAGFKQYPPAWGLHGFSLTPTGRGIALRHFTRALELMRDPGAALPESLARMCENFLYWHHGPIEPAAFERPDHHAQLTLPASITRKGSWSIALSAIRAINPEDPGYRENPFALDRQKLFSVWHEQIGLVLDGSHSKNQHENSTFSAKTSTFSDKTSRTVDYYPIDGGSVSREGSDLIARAVYKTFYGQVRLRVVSDNSLQIEFSVDPAANSGPFTAGFTIFHTTDELVSLSGKRHTLSDEPFELSGDQLGGGLKIGSIRISGPPNMKFHWPLAPYNSYEANHQPTRQMWQPRLSLELTPAHPKAAILLMIEP